MKKLVSLFVALVAFFVLAVPAHADSAITANEQQILTELDQGVTVGGKHFGISATDRMQAENYLKQHDLTSAEVNAVVSNIQAARALVLSQNIDVTNINSLNELIKALPRDVINQLKNYVTAVANILGLTISFAPGQVSVMAPAAEGSQAAGSVSKPASNSVVSGGGNVVYSSGDAVKQTGANFTASFVAFGALLAAAAGAFVVGKKNQRLA